ncbi:unnamed protein product [Gordionus sp. m RMFG-2023]|uniref:carnitine O-palmitoyltransferase 1, liver isoform-like n=1 Tax=Gordionus sp. m RMFG-2023 TaxID=3053472 RepID=UPI0030E4FC7A
MAEAHSAVAFSFSVTDNGIDFDINWDAWKGVWYTSYRSWRKKISRFRSIFWTGFFPVALTSWPIFLILVAILKRFKFTGEWHYAERFRSYLPLWPSIIVDWLCCVVVAMLIWFAFVTASQYALRVLLLYQRWIFEPFGKPTLPTKIWAVFVKVLIGSRPLLYGLQHCLPRLPVPRLHSTMERYLKTVKPLLPPEQYAEMSKLASEFESTIGPKLQRYLILKSWWFTNYVSDWWEEYVYLSGRSPIMVNSNYYAMDTLMFKATNVQAARAANCIHALFKFRRLIYYQTLKPIMFQGSVPLCSHQYERMFNTTRVPGIDSDKIQHHDDSQHVVVYHKGRFFKLLIYNKGHLMEPCEIEIQIQSVLDDQTPPAPGEKDIPALTAGERKPWAIARKQFFHTGVNRASLECIERAAFFVTLDDEEQCNDPENPAKLDAYAGSLLHGKGNDRWFDKSFTLVVFKNARIGFNAEHSWADAPIMAHLVVEMLTMDHSMGYTENGHCKSTTKNLLVPLPAKLGWNLKPECKEVIENQFKIATSLLEDVDITLLTHDKYGKGFIKGTRCSPDAYLQMALQLAYYKDKGKFDLTYEASMTRLFREGRTETVRTVSEKSCAWVKSMLDPTCNNFDRVNLLKAACQAHVLSYKWAMTGNGIDRHLFCLYVVSKYLEKKNQKNSLESITTSSSKDSKTEVTNLMKSSPFLKRVLSEPWRLSTSQTTHLSAEKLDIESHKHLISAGGGFGPVADDGYGVSYIIAGENRIYFHISSKKSSPATNSVRFKNHILQALSDMQNLLKPDNAGTVSPTKTATTSDTKLPNANGKT